MIVDFLWKLDYLRGRPSLIEEYASAMVSEAGDVENGLHTLGIIWRYSGQSKNSPFVLELLMSTKPQNHRSFKAVVKS